MTIKQKHVADTSFFDILNDYEIESLIENPVPVTSLDLLDSILCASIESDASNDSKIKDQDEPQHSIMTRVEEKPQTSVRDFSMNSSKKLDISITHSNLNISEKDKFLLLALNRMNMDLQKVSKSKGVKIEEKTRPMTASAQTSKNMKSTSKCNAEILLREFLETIDAHIKRLKSVQNGQCNGDSYNVTFIKKVDAIHKFIINRHEGSDVIIEKNVSKVEQFIRSFLAKAKRQVLSVKQLSRVSAHLQSLARPKFLCKFKYWRCKLCGKKQIPFERMKCPVCGRPKSNTTRDTDPKLKQMKLIESEKQFLSITKNKTEDNVDKKERDFYLFKKNDLELGLRTSLIEDAQEVLEILNSNRVETKFI